MFLIDHKELGFDKYNLDTECERQAMKFLEWAEKAVEAGHRRDRLKIDLERKYAELDSKYRREIMHETGKVTEKQVEARILQNMDYQEIEDNYLITAEEASHLYAIRQAFEQRKSMLEMECKLFLSSYYSEVDTKFTGKEAKKMEVDRIKRDLEKDVV